VLIPPPPAQSYLTWAVLAAAERPERCNSSGVRVPLESFDLPATAAGLTWWS
jgi:hypothetical protein